MKIGNRHFEGPYNMSQLCNRPGVYVVLDISSGSAATCIDIGESGDVAARVSGHDRKWCRALHARGWCAFAVMYTDSYDDRVRRCIERDVRLLVPPLCGDL